MNAGTWLTFHYGDETLTARRLPRTGQNRRVQIRVQPDERVEARAPADASDAEVQAALQKRAGWIYRQLADFRARNEQILPREHVSGETHYYLGCQYLLKILPHSPHAPRVRLYRGQLEVHLQPEQHCPAMLLAAWYHQRARTVCQRRLAALLPTLTWAQQMPPLRLQRMRTRWGSCSPTGTLTINPHLVKAPRDCVDYVLIHELCHLIEHNHSPVFYRLLDRQLPNWRHTKTRLDELAGRLLN